MSNTLRDRIAAVLSEHVEDQLTNYDTGRNECGCGHQGDATYNEHLADAVIEALGRQESSFISGDDGRRIVVSEWDRKQFTKPPSNGWQHRYVTEWSVDE